MKATQLLKKHHDAVKKLFADFLDTTDRAPKKREELCEKIATELEIHAQIEEEIFYPAMQEFRSSRRPRISSRRRTRSTTR